MALKDSQTSMYEHSEVKVRLLKLYLERYLNVLNEAQYISNVQVYDLFCSEGIYENGGKGSPVIILETIKDIHFRNVHRNRSRQFHCHFNDIDNTKVDKLKNAIAEKKLHYQQIGGLTYSTDDYRNILPKTCLALSKLKQERAFVFIDPYGYKDIRISDIQSLLVSKKTEVLLFLPTQFMFRFESKATPESLKEFISELVPEKEWPASETGIEFIENLKQKFREKLGEEHYVDSFIITRDKNQFFCLFFFTSHIYGFDRMLDAKWEIDEEEGRGWSLGSTTEDLFSTVEKRPDTYQLERKLTDFLTEPRTNAEIYRFTLHNGHLPKHTLGILEKLQNENKLNVSTKDGSKPRKGAYYLSFKNLKDNPEKILVKMN